MTTEPPSEGVASRLSAYPVAETIAADGGDRAPQKGSRSSIDRPRRERARPRLTMQEEQLIVFGDLARRDPVMVDGRCRLELPSGALWQDPWAASG